MPRITRIGVGELIGASKKYLDAQVKKANTDGNAYLTLAEAKRLPADLRDNYDAFRKQGNARVSVRKLGETFTQYVAARAQAADKNKDGYLTATDAKGLPKDLRDNFLNYVAATRPPQPQTRTEQGRAALAQYVANVLFNTGNPEGAAFRTAVLDWRDPADAAQVRATIDAEVAAWSPTAPGWQKSTANGATTYTGALFQLYTEVTFQPSKPPRVFVEID
jgi:hypothetical protein